MLYLPNMAFDRGRNRGSSGRDTGFRPRFGDRGSRGPVEMHRATCDQCGKECEVPFRPTSGKPVFCSNCCEHKNGSDSRRPEGRNFDRPERSEDRQMFEATCADCGNKCQVPFRPTQDKPVFCSDCFGNKKTPGGKGSDKFSEINAKLDKILSLLSPVSTVPKTPVETVEKTEKPKKAAKASKKKAEEAPVEPAEEVKEATPEESI